MDNYCWLYSEKVLHRNNYKVCGPQLVDGVVYDSVTRYSKSEFVWRFCAHCTQTDCDLCSKYGKKASGTPVSTPVAAPVATPVVPDEEDTCNGCPSYATCFPKDADADVDADLFATPHYIDDEQNKAVLIAPAVNEFVDFTDAINARRVVGTVPLIDGAELYCQALVLDVSDTFKLIELLFDNRGSSTWLKMDESDIVKIPACKINVNGEILDIDETPVELINDTYHSSYLLDAKYDMDDAVRIAKSLFRRISEALNSD